LGVILAGVECKGGGGHVAATCQAFGGAEMLHERRYNNHENGPHSIDCDVTVGLNV
jgi:hypothetical protein